MFWLREAAGGDDVVVVVDVDAVVIVVIAAAAAVDVVSQGWLSSDNCMYCHTEIEVADPTFYLTQSQYTDTGSTSLSADPRMPGARQGSHWSANF